MMDCLKRWISGSVIGVTVFASVASADTAVYFIHNDHLGTPQVVTNQSQSVVWEADYSPFGEVDITTERVPLNARFPGQYTDEASGVYYNYYRDYDPSIGRYIQSDPIGLDGGVNTYSYVLNNPFSYIDPDGQIAQVVVPIALLSVGLYGAYLSGQQAANSSNQLSNPIDPTDITGAMPTTSSRSCPGTPSGDPDCDEINKDVQRAKAEFSKYQGVGAACRAGMSIWQLRERKASWLRLAQARSKSIQRCWNGGDESHQREVGSSWEHVQKCDALIR